MLDLGRIDAALHHENDLAPVEVVAFSSIPLCHRERGRTVYASTDWSSGLDLSVAYRGISKFNLQIPRLNNLPVIVINESQFPVVQLSGLRSRLY